MKHIKISAGEKVHASTGLGDSFGWALCGIGGATLEVFDQIDCKRCLVIIECLGLDKKEGEPCLKKMR